ncbi:hypothetical protein IQ06DRAFT_209658, partial [Phaeosphaeriaceae sp. SRC1lsM3a]
LLCDVVQVRSHVQVILDDGRRYHLAKLVAVGGRAPRDGGVEMRVVWKEMGGDMLLLERGLQWIKEKVK